MHTKLYLLPFVLLALHSNNYSCGHTFFAPEEPQAGTQQTQQSPRPMERIQPNTRKRKGPHQRDEHHDNKRAKIIAASIVVKKRS